MITVEELMRAAWAALSRGDTAERDRLLGLARNLMRARDRKRAGAPVIEGEFIVVGAPIALPDRSKETIQ